jgi:pilus assembly protein Flp/PilA
MNKFLLFKNENGATAIEYALIVALVSIIGVIASTMSGEEISLSFNTVATSLSSANSR